MSVRSVEPALAVLLPSLADGLPAELTSHAATLYVQSRSHASALKPEEEIARPYACAEIACKKLSRALRLPPLMGRPPCPPNIYRKLYTFLEGALMRSSAGARQRSLPSTPRKSARQQTNAIATTPVPGSAMSTPRRAQPTESLMSSPTKTPSRATPAATKPPPPVGITPRTSPSKAQLHAAAPQSQPGSPTRGDAILSGRTGKRKAEGEIRDAPSWTMKYIRIVCKVQPGDTPEMRDAILARPASGSSKYLPSHIFAGLSTTIEFARAALRHPETNETDREFFRPLDVPPTSNDGGASGEDNPTFKQRLITLILALYLSVYQQKIADEDFETDVLARMSHVGLALLGIDEMKVLEEVDRWIAVLVTKGWVHGTEWFDNIHVGEFEDGNAGDESVRGGSGARRDDQEEGDDFDNGDDWTVLPAVDQVKRRRVDYAKPNDSEQRKKGLLPGLGTMMQQQFDFLSDEKRASYSLWRRNVMERIAEIQKGALVRIEVPTSKDPNVDWSIIGE